MFNGELKLCGIATKYHSEHQTMVEIVYVNKLEEKKIKTNAEPLYKRHNSFQTPRKS